ncbi:MAG: PDZ domain-containing protein [Fuerstiella sp.]|jgi:hypothetical protein|nr:PDZ domain-containing protein [Fuerstiella sp.]
MTFSSLDRSVDVAARVSAKGIIAVAVLFSSTAICQPPETPQAVIHEEDVRLTSLIEDLGAREFERRATASNQLRELTAAELAALTALSVEHPSAEVIIRLIAEVDARYASEDQETVRTASMALESLSQTARLVLAEGANESLRKHWQTRVDLTISELREHGAHIKNGSFANDAVGRWLPQNSVGTVNIFIDEGWRGDADALHLFARLSALAGPRTFVGGLGVYLLDGHPLTDKQHAQLAEFVGRERIAERSRVALGIRPHSARPGRGVLIQTVTKGSTAAAATLQPGDLILGLVARPANNPKNSVPEPSGNLRDFDDLVERLKEYRPGDVVYLTVIRNFRMTALPGGLFGQRNIMPRAQPNDQDRKNPDGTKPAHGEEVIEATLKGWQELETVGR